MALLLVSLGPSRTQAANGINRSLPFSATLTTKAGDPVTGIRDVTFRLYTAESGGDSIWTESYTGSAALTVTKGRLSTLLGSRESLATVDFNSDSFYLGITVGSDRELSPRIRLGAAPYAVNADTVDGRGEGDFALLGGRSGGQTLTGGTDGQDALRLSATSNSSKGKIYLGQYSVLNEANTRFGVGTTSPAATLQATATDVDQLRLAFNDSNYLTVTVSSSGSATLDLVGSSPTLTVADALTVSGATTLSSTLAVSGASTLAGATTLSAAGTALTVTNNATIGGNLTVTGTLSASTQSFTSAAVSGNLSVTGTSTLTGLVTATAGVTTSTNLTTTGTGDLVSGDDLTVADDATVTGDLTVSGTLTPAILSLTNLTLSGDAAINGGDLTTTATTLNVDVGNTGSILFRDGSNILLSVVDAGTTGNVTATGTLTVNGSATLTGAVTTSAALTVGTDLTVSGGDLSGINSASIDLGEAGEAGEITFTAGSTGDFVFSVDSDSNVGIGTANPATKLDVVDTASTGNIMTVTGTNNSTLSFSVDSVGRTNWIATGQEGSGSNGGAYFYADGYQESWFNAKTRTNTSGRQLVRLGNISDTFRLDLLNDAGTSVTTAGIFSVRNNAPANSFAVDASGNLGIGTASPSTTLHVVGDALITGGDLTGANSAAIDLGEATSGAITFTAGSSGDFVFSTDADSSVGIGTTNPANLLDLVRSQNGATVVGLTNATSGTVASTEYRLGEGLTTNDRYLSLGYGNSGYTTSGYGRANQGTLVTTLNVTNGLVIGTNANAPVKFVTNSDGVDNERLRISGDGNVGIGTTNPTTPLHVVGDATITGGDITGANSAAIDLGEATSGAITFTAGSSGDFVFSVDANSNVQVTAGAAPTVDLFEVSNAGQASATASLNAFDITHAVSGVDGNIGLRITSTYAGGGSDGLTYRNLQIANGSPTNAVGNDSYVGIDIAGLTDPGASITSDALTIGSGWDNAITILDATTELNLSTTTPTIAIANGGTLTVTDGTNTLFSVADAGSTGTTSLNRYRVNRQDFSAAGTDDSTAEWTGENVVFLSRAGTQTFNLGAAAAGNSGALVTIIVTDTSNNTRTVNATSAGGLLDLTQVSGNVSMRNNQAGDTVSMTVYSDGTNWRVLSRDTR